MPASSKENMWLPRILTILTGALGRRDTGAAKIAPKVMIVSMVSVHPFPALARPGLANQVQFDAEANAWPDQLARAGLGNIHGVSVRVPGLFPLYPEVRCVDDGTICQVTAGMGEINAAASISALVTSTAFDLSRTYWLLAGIAGVSPEHGTLGSVAFARYSVQVALQYEIDAREIPSDFPTGYLAIGTTQPDEYPTMAYGTEVIELNMRLRDLGYELARNADLQDSDAATAHRARYLPDKDRFTAATQKPGVIRCDVATSDVYYTGELLSEAFGNTTATWTNGTGVYCMTASEDSAALSVLVRWSIEGVVDFGRVMVMRSGESSGLSFVLSFVLSSLSL